MPDAEAETFLASCGVIRVKSLRHLLLAAKGFGFHPHGIGKRVLLFSNSGGPGVITTDRLIDGGIEMPPLPNAYAADLEALMPPEAAVANPIDMLADAREDRFGPAFESALRHASGQFDAILMIHVVPFMVDAGPIIDELARLAKDTPMPLFHSMMGTLEHKQDWFATMESAGVAMFNDAEEMAETAAILAQYPPLKAAVTT